MNMKLNPDQFSSTQLRAIGAVALVTCSLLLSLSVSAQNPDLPYSSGSTGVDGPLTVPATATPRYEHAMTYDSQRQRVVLFGGYGPANDTWEWDGTSWTQRASANVPPARYRHAMAYDSQRQRVVLFGGYVNNAFVNDTWEWDGTTWTQKTPSSAPPIRADHAMVYDAQRQRVVLMGGVNSAYLSDTWEWDGTSWTQKTPATNPGARAGHALAYDVQRQRTVLFSGYLTGNWNDETWEWDGSNWAKKAPGTSPSPRFGHGLAYDVGHQRTVLFGGYRNPGAKGNDTWEWDGINWTQKAPLNTPQSRYFHTVVYDGQRQQVVLFGGYDPALNDTWVWDGTNWAYKAGASFPFDMTGRANGIWNFTSITVPAGVTVYFKKNAANAPVTWLATENVQITGAVSVAGSIAQGSNVPELVGKGGPGGFDGGLGGTRFDISGLYAGLPGQGPGGGAAGTTVSQRGADGTYRTTYGNVYLQPLIGGSGGGGGASSAGGNGGSGGGGGGAILIASSKDITVTGSIEASGGGQSYGGGSYGGLGSGGAVRLVADRVLGTGVIDADSTGRIRLEGFYRELASGAHSVAPSGAAPTETFAPSASGQLIVSNVAGSPIAQPPSGSLLSPDVVFTQAGQITVTVAATSIPNGTPVTLRITTSGGTINLPAQGTPAVTLSNGTASFTATVPAGLGTIQAAAQYTVP